MQPRTRSPWIACGLIALAAGACVLGRDGQVPSIAGWSSQQLGDLAAGLCLLLALAAASYFAGTRLRRTGAANALLSNALLPAAIVDKHQQIMRHNAAFAALTGAPESSLEDRDIREFLGSDLWEARVAATQAADAQHLLDPIALTREDDQECWVLLQVTTPASLAKDQHLVTCWDQTLARQEERDQSKELASTRSLVASSHDFVVQLDGYGQIHSVNERAKLVLGGADALPNIAMLLEAKDQARVEQAIARCLESKASVRLRRLGLKPANRKQRIYVDAQIQANPSNADRVTLTGGSINHMIAAEAKIRSQLASLKQMFEESPDAIYVARRTDGQILRFNQRFSQLLGYNHKALAQQTEQTLGIWERPADRQQALQDLIENPTGVSCEARMIRGNGEAFDAEISLRNMKIDDALCTMQTIRDISVRVAADAALAESQEKFLNTFQNSPDGIAIIRKGDGLIYDINPALVAASGYSRDYFLGKSLFDLNLMANMSEMAPSDQDLANRKRFDNVEMTFRTLKGEVIPAVVSAKEFEMRGETYLLTIVRDERELRSARARVARSEERFRGAFENAQLAIMLINMEGCIFQSNRFAQDLLAYTESELEGVHVSRLVPQEDRISLKVTLTQMLQGGEPCVRSERRMQCQNGLEIWANFQVVLQDDPAGDEAYFIIQAADVTDIKLSHRRMERMAFYDTLTDLANRRLFQDRLQQAIEHCHRSSHLSALLYLDLDQFKRVNDTLGHEAGDSLLREVALRLTECVRTEDTVGRTGGDEFTVLLFNVESAAAAGIVAEKILDSLREPILVSGHNLVVTTSIGVAIIPTDGRDANVVMKNADLAMYRAKERGRNNYQFFSEDMNTRAILRLRTENELREGITRGEFFLLHQPKHRISDGKLIGVESLVRWNHPSRGMLPPNEFIQIAEETGAIVELGSWIIEAACHAGNTFASIASEPFSTAVNISPRQFRDPKLISHVRRCLRSSGLPPHLLQIEITETMLMQDVEAAATIIERLHELGAKLAIDDFGTGYSSLNYLKKFPIQTVKVDRSFVTDIPHNSDDMAITAAVIAMAHRLNMDVVAEGVETQGQLDFLANNDCEYAQGYLFSKPVTDQDIIQLIRSEKAGHQSPQPNRAVAGSSLPNFAANSDHSGSRSDEPVSR
ncbi:MAG: EAL domain-containing protein [Pseudomonadales bacterium]